MNKIELYNQADKIIKSHTATQDELFQALHTLQQLAEENFIPAATTLGYISQQFQQFEKSFNYFKQAMELGDEEASYQVATCLCLGKGIEKNQKKAFEIMSQLAKNENNITAIFELGLYFLNGIGIGKDAITAFKCFEHAAKNNCSGAQNSLALCFLNATGTKQDINAALYWFYHAAKNGHIPAYCSAAYLIENYDNFGKDKELATDFYVVGARLGDNNALQYIIDNNINIEQFPTDININLKFN